MMKKSNTTKANEWLAKMQAAILAGAKTSVKLAHKELLEIMGDDGKDVAWPDWARYPVARDFWLQHDPVKG